MMMIMMITTTAAGTTGMTATVTIRASSPTTAGNWSRTPYRKRSPGGYAMLAAFVLTAVDFIANVVIFIFTDAVGLGPLSGFCHLVIYVPMVIFIGIAARLLFTLGSPGLIVTAIVMNFIVLLILGGATFIAILMLATGALPAPNPVLVTALAIQKRFQPGQSRRGRHGHPHLTSREVADGYAAQDQDQWRRRRRLLIRRAGSGIRACFGSERRRPEVQAPEESNHRKSRPSRLARPS